MHTLENPLAAPPSKPRNPDDAAFVASQLGEEAAAAMRKLKGKHPIQAAEAREDFGADEDLELSAAEHADLVKDKVLSELMAREASALQKFFGRSFEIPPLPEEATTERIAEWREQGFELHYLPPVSMAEVKRDPDGKILEVIPMELPGWKKKPGKEYTPGKQWGMEFFNEVKNGNLDPSALDLKGGWLLCDTRERPPYDDGKQMYSDDTLAPALAELNRQGLIKQASFDGTTKLPPTSRFGISPRELADPRVMAALVKVLNIESGEASLQRAMEFNILGNLHHPEWDDTSTSEWFADQYDAGSQQLCGGNSGGGGLSHVSSFDLGYRLGGIGFRLLGRFSQAKAEPPKK